MYQVPKNYKEMIRQRWTKEYYPQCNVIAKRNRGAKHILVVGDLVWLIDESVKKHFFNMIRLIVVYPGGEDIVRSTRLKIEER